MSNTIKFSTNIYAIDSWMILHFPNTESLKLTSRGMMMIEGEINGFSFKAPAEPDGMGSHWLRLDDELMEKCRLSDGDEVRIEAVQAEEWDEPDLPPDLAGRLDETGAILQWDKITTKARWEWIRWIRFTKNPKTREKRINSACDMLRSGKKRPCCFDRTRCTETAVSKNGVLLQADEW